ncbi:gluconolactonase [Pedobacter sp. UYEF25]
MKEEFSSLTKSNRLSAISNLHKDVSTPMPKNHSYQFTVNRLSLKLLTFNRLGSASTFIIALTLLLSSFTAFSQTLKTPLFIQDSLKLISNQFKFTEGASVDRKGNVFFTDQPNNTIWQYSIEGKLSLFLSPAGRANGTMFDKKGNLIVCADEHNQIWSINKNKKIEVLLNNFEGKNLNGPNDVWIDANGGIFFTDPYYQRDYWTRKSAELHSESVYYLSKSSHKAKLVANGLKQPNGIVGTPDGKYLYVSDIGAWKTYRYTIGANGKLTDRELIINEGSDGMTLDAAGNIYLSGKGVTIFDKQGIKIGHIDVAEEWVGNLCFGGKDKDVLFITASKSLYKIKMAIKGVE